MRRMPTTSTLPCTQTLSADHWQVRAVTRTRYRTSAWPGFALVPSLLYRATRNRPKERTVAERANEGMLAAYGIEGCGCSECVGKVVSARPFPDNLMYPFIVCETCGNKRCPHAAH